MVIARHLILTGYGHWLPNDPRGSTSREVVARKLRGLGELHVGRKFPQPARQTLKSFHRNARRQLEHSVLWFDAAKRQVIADAFAQTMQDCRYTCFACAILSNHAHLIIRKHHDRAETMIDHFRTGSALRLCRLADVPNNHPVWNTGHYKKFLFTPEDITRTATYIRDNPARERIPEQNFPFVKLYSAEWHRQGKSIESRMNKPRQEETRP